MNVEKNIYFIIENLYLKSKKRIKERDILVCIINELYLYLYKI